MKWQPRPNGLTEDIVRARLRVLVAYLQDLDGRRANRAAMIRALVARLTEKDG